MRHDLGLDGLGLRRRDLRRRVPPVRRLRRRRPGGGLVVQERERRAVVRHAAARRGRRGQRQLQEGRRRRRRLGGVGAPAAAPSGAKIPEALIHGRTNPSDPGRSGKIVRARVHTRSSIDQQGEGSARVPVACLLLSLPLHGPLMAAAVERTHCWRRRRREREGGGAARY